MSVVEGRALGVPPAKWSALGLAIIVVLALAGLVWHREKAQSEAPALVLARRYLTLELHLGESRTGSFATLYRPFRPLVVPRSQAADFTRWIIAETLPRPAGLRVTAVNWRPRRPVVAAAKGRHLAVQISYFWQRTFQSRGRTGGMATVRFTLTQGRHGYRISAVGWNAIPSVSAANQHTSFAYDLDRIRSVPTPPMGMPPSLKPRVNNP